MAAASVLATASFAIAWMTVLLQASNPETLPVSTQQQPLDGLVQSNQSPSPTVDLTGPRLNTSAVTASDSEAIQLGNGTGSAVLPPFTQTPGLLQTADCQAEAMLLCRPAY